MPSDADPLIAYQQQLATSTPRPWISTRPLRSSARVGCAFPVESPVRVLIMTQPGPGSDHVRVRRRRIRSRVLSLFRRSPGSLPLDRVPSCSRLRTFPAAPMGPGFVGTGSSCPAGRAALPRAAEPHLVWRLRVLSPPVMALLGVGLLCQHDIVEMVDPPSASASQVAQEVRAEVLNADPAAKAHRSTPGRWGHRVSRCPTHQHRRQSDTW